MPTTSAVAKAIIQRQQRTPADPAAGGFGGFGSIPAVSGNPGQSPLVQSYGDWATGRNLGRAGALPRDPRVFLSGSFSPLSPMLPVPIDAPDPDTGRVDPRRWQYPVSWNMPHGVPGSEGLKLSSFQNLRVIGQTYSVARACIELRKNELLGLEWDIVPTKDTAKELRGDQKARRRFDERRATMRRFWRRPDQQYFAFRDWFKTLLDDVLVIDALSLYLWPAAKRGKGVLGSDLGQLAILDGSTVRPLLDVHGATPLPPAPGYQQYLFGVPRTDLVTMQANEDIAGMADAMFRDYPADRLIYRPYTPQSWTPYGLSMIEQALVPILSGIQRQQYQLDFFSEGTIPGLFISPGGGPDGTSLNPNQIRELQDALNAMAGDPAWKHKIIVLPSGSTTSPQVPAELAGAFDEIIMTQVCMGFGVMPMELGITPRSSSTGHTGGAANQMGKQSESVMERKSNRPLLEWFADIFNYVIQDVCGQDDMQWWWEGLEQDEDEQTRTAIQKEKVSIGLMSIDEARVEDGKQPWSKPITSEPVLVTATGIIPLGGLDATTGQPPTPPGLPAAPGVPGAASQPATAAPAPPVGQPPATKRFNPAEPRDDHGQWSLTGAITHTLYQGMHRATGDEKSAFRQRFGKAIPPAWSDVHIADDLDSAKLLVKGKDAKGRVQSVYSAAHVEGQAAAKYERIKQLVPHLDKLDHAVERDAGHDDSAAALLLIRRLGMRPGSDKDTGAKEHAHGATNLRAKHVSVDGDTTKLDFVGKKGVHIQLTTHDPLIAKTLGSRLTTRHGDDRLFDTDETKTRAYMRSTGVPAGFLLKDLRTTHANVVALREIKARGDVRPSSKAEFLRWRRQVATAVSAELGNTPTLALSSYINPSVWGRWVGGEDWL